VTVFAVTAWCVRVCSVGFADRSDRFPVQSSVATSMWVFPIKRHPGQAAVRTTAIRSTRCDQKLVETERCNSAFFLVVSVYIACSCFLICSASVVFRCSYFCKCGMICSRWRHVTSLRRCILNGLPCFVQLSPFILERDAIFLSTASKVSSRFNMLSTVSCNDHRTY